MSTTDATNVGDMQPAAHPAARAAVIAAWMTTGLFALLMTASGIAYVAGPPKVAAAMAALGYPPYFARLLGVAKLLGVAGVLAPRQPTMREWAYAGFTFDLVAAVVSHVATGEASHVPLPLVVLALMLASYVLRKRARLAS
jgi:hypothetical protein